MIFNFIWLVAIWSVSIITKDCTLAVLFSIGYILDFVSSIRNIFKK